MKTNLAAESWELSHQGEIAKWSGFMIFELSPLSGAENVAGPAGSTNLLTAPGQRSGP